VIRIEIEQDPADLLPKPRHTMQGIDRCDDDDLDYFDDDVDNQIDV